MYYLLLDTNIYLHCQLFDTLPWDEITGKSGPFSILLPLQVLRELDSVKDRGEGAVNKKARRVSRKLGDILLDGIASKLPIIQCDVPSVDGFLSGFSTVIADDLIRFKHCRVDVRTVTMDVPESLQTDEDKHTDWGFCEKPYRIFLFYQREDSWPLDSFCKEEFDPLTHGTSVGIKEIEIDLWEAESGSINWTIYDPALPESVSGTLNFIIED